MYGNERRKTNFDGRPSNAITPNKRHTEGISSLRRSEVRPSIGGHPRQSIFGRASTIPSRDVKALAHGNIDKIYNFFVEKGEEPPCKSIIQSPTGKDFAVIFETIYQHLSEGFVCSYQHPEEDVIPIFKALNYPYTLKDSYFKPVGTSHGWPHLLDALGWLIDLVNISLSVNNNAQNMLFGDILERNQVEEKTLSYAWYTSIYRDYTNDRKVIENRNIPFWEKQRDALRNAFNGFDGNMDVIGRMKNELEQLKFDCDEIESETGQENQLKEEISRIKDDIRKADEYFEQTEQLREIREKNFQKILEELQEKQKENERIQKKVNEVKERIEEQIINHGIDGKQVREMNLENSKDKELVSEMRGELDKLSKEMWTLKNEDLFKEQKGKFQEVIDHIYKTINGLEIQITLTPMKSPSDERELKIGWDTLTNIWIPEINRHLHQRKLELETEQSRFSDKFAASQERIQIELEMLEEAKKREAREERQRQNERDEWKVSRQNLEKHYDELENEMEVLKKKLKMDGSLEKEIEEERVKIMKIEEELSSKHNELINEITRKLDEIFAATAEIENEKLLIQKEVNELENAMKSVGLQ